MPPHAPNLETRYDTTETVSMERNSVRDSSSAKVKCVLLGDGAIGKTSLVVSYTTNGYPTEYVPTAFDNYAVVVTVDEKPVRVQLCDTAGQDDFDALRPLCYPGTDVFLLCFSVVSPTSYHNIIDKWLPEIRRHCPHTPIILVGTQADLRNDVKELIKLANYNESPVSEADAKSRAQEIDAVTYIECSALTQKNLKEVFDQALLTALDTSKHSKKHAKCKRSKTKKSGSHSKRLSNNNNTAPSHKKSWQRFCCFL